MNEPLYSKEEVSLFLAKFHQDEYGKKISKIKMQKGLYFIFAYFSQFVYRSRGSEIQKEFPNVSRELFEPDFQAWSYGPVDYSVYVNYDDIVVRSESIDTDAFLYKAGSEIIGDYLDTLTRQIFNSTDFGLVELSHQDACWDDNYFKEEEYHKEPIPKSSILQEYEY